MPHIALAQFARIMNVSRQAVDLAIKQGRLDKSITRNAKGRPKIDPELGKAEWEANTDPTRNRRGPAAMNPKEAAPAKGTEDPDQQSILISRQQTESYKAKITALEYEARAGRVVEAAKVEREWVRLVTEARTKILAVPSKIISQIPHLTTTDARVIEKLLKEALQELSNGTA